MKSWLALLLGCCSSQAIACSISAQVIPDGTTDTVINPTDSGTSIDAGDRAGNNLFHSFQEFSIPNASEAFFNNANDIVNIFSRVTGGNISNIEGLLRANGNANLFLINPAGIILGEGAALDIGGSFTATTAESIVFSDDIEFSTVDTENEPLLTINQPLGLNFGTNPGNIAVNGSNLRINNGATIGIIGGNINVSSGQINALGGRVELVSLAQEGRVELNNLTENTIASIEIPQNIARSDISLTDGADISVQSAGGGSIDIYARNLSLSGGGGASIIRAGIASESRLPTATAGDIAIDLSGDLTLTAESSIINRIEPFGFGDTGDIDVRANNLFMSGGGLIGTSILGSGNAGNVTANISNTITATGIAPTSSIPREIINMNPDSSIPSGIVSVVLPGGIGNAGNINVTTQELNLTEGAVVAGTTLGQGDGGVVRIQAETIRADGESSLGLSSGVFSNLAQPGIGNAGNIEIATNDLVLTDGGRVSVSTLSRGNAGTIAIAAEGEIIVRGIDADGFNSGIFSTVEQQGIGNAGDIEITTGNLALSEGGIISVTTLGRGSAGQATILAEEIAIAGETPTEFNSGIYSQVFRGAIGDSRGIDLTANNLTLTQGGAIDASTSGQGRAGAIALDVLDTISVDGEDSAGNPSGIIGRVGNTATGNAAGININTNDLILTNRGEISVESLGQGNAGNLNLKANSLSLTQASLFASTPIGNGGNINLQIAENITLNNNSTISAQALEDADGGNINIDAEFVIATPNRDNDIIAAAERGIGGNIDITTNSLFGFAQNTSSFNSNNIDASSQFGLDGTININELDINPIQALEKLPIEIIDVTKLIAQNLCQQGKDSEFVVTGKGSVASNPFQTRNGEINEVDLVQPAIAPQNNISRGEKLFSPNDPDPKPEITEAQGWIINDRGNLELVAHSTETNSSIPQPINSKICSAAIDDAL